MAFAHDPILEAEVQEDCEFMASLGNIARHVSFNKNTCKFRGLV